MLSCFKYRNRLGTYLDGELNKKQSESLSAHLTRCPDCQAALEELRSLEKTLLSFEPQIPAFDLSARILSEARNRRLFNQTRSSWNSGQWTWAYRTLKLAAILIGLGLGAVLGKDINLITPLLSPDIKPSQTIALETTFNLDIFSAAPNGSIEAATIALLQE